MKNILTHFLSLLTFKKKFWPSWIKVEFLDKMCRSKDFRVDKKLIQESEHYAILAFLLALLCGSLTEINSAFSGSEYFM